MARLADFEGAWRMARQIDDRASGRTGRFEGVARFVFEGEGLIYRETGELSFDGAKPMAASRTYLWRQAGEGIDVLFEDGRFFHHIGADQAPVAHHDCAPDSYDVAYDFTLWPDWRATWTVEGPRKNYTMRSAYVRIAP